MLPTYHYRSFEIHSTIRACIKGKLQQVPYICQWSSNIVSSYLRDLWGLLQQINRFVILNRLILYAMNTSRLCLVQLLEVLFPQHHGPCFWLSVFFPNGWKQTERSFEVVSSEIERRGEFFIVVSTKQITLNKCC